MNNKLSISTYGSKGNSRVFSKLAFAVASLIAFLSIYLLHIEIAALPLVRTAELLELASGSMRISKISRDELDRYSIDQQACYQRPLRANLNYTLFRLSSDIKDHAPLEDRLQSFVLANKIVRLNLRCNPMDGAAWANLASLEALAAFEPQRYSSLIGFSIRYSPFEGAAIALRWSSLVNVVDLPNRLSDSSLRRDLCRFITGAALQDSIILLRALYNSATSLNIIAAMRDVPKQRMREVIVAARQEGSSYPNEQDSLVFSLTRIVEESQDETGVCGDSLMSYQRLPARTKIRFFE